MSDILRIISQKKNVIKAKTLQNEQITLFIIFDAALTDDNDYILAQPIDDGGRSVVGEKSVYRRMRADKITSLVPADESSANELVELFNERNLRGEVIERLAEDGKPPSKRRKFCYVREKGTAVPSDIYFAVVEIWVKANGKLLLLQRSRNKDFGLKWECPGGTVRFGEKYVEAAQRELFEETGIFVDEKELAYLGQTKRSNWICHSFLAEIDADVDEKVRLQREECADFKLVSIEDMNGFTCELTEGHLETFLKYCDVIASNDNYKRK